MTNPCPTAFAREESKRVKGRRGLCRERKEKSMSHRKDST